MCLGIPGQIVEISDASKKLALAEVSGVQREVNVICVTGVDDGPLDHLIGTWVLIHVGFAMARIDEEEAAKTLDVLKMLGEAQEEIEAMRASKAMLEAAS
jgi:hydrogenase expression/formation protein HypC